MEKNIIGGEIESVVIKYQGDNTELAEYQDGDTKLVYTGEFKQFIRKHPGLIKNVKQLIKILESNLTLQKTSNVDGTIFVESKGTHPEHNRHYYEVITMEENVKHSFFVKENLEPYESGYDELLTMAAISLEKLRDIDRVRIVQYQLGFRDRNRSYFVSKTEEDFEDYVDIKKRLQQGSDEDRLRLSALDSRFLKIREALHSQSITEAEDYNFGYDETKDEFVLFDLRSHHTVKEGLLRETK